MNKLSIKDDILKSKFITIILLVWSFSKNFRKMNLLKNIQKKEKIQDNIYSLLFEKEEDSNNKNNLPNKNERNKKKIIISGKVSEKCNSLLSSIYDKINLINYKNTQLNHINSLSLQKISKKYYRMNSVKTYSCLKDLKNNFKIKMNSTHATNYLNSDNKFNKNKIINGNQKRAIKSSYLRSKNESYKNIFNNEKLNNINNKRKLSFILKNKDEKLKKYATINIDELYKVNDKRFINLERFNDDFRIEMNNTFYKFNPKNHLKQLNEMQRDNISLRQNIQNIKEKINNRIGDLCSKKDLLKQNNKIKEEKNQNIKSNSAENFQSKTGKIPSKIKLKSQKYIFPIIKRKNYKDKESQKLVNIKAKDDLIDKTLKKLYISLDTKNILKYINDIKEEKLNNNKEIEEYRENKYFPALKEVKQYIKKYEMNKLNNNDENKKEEIEKNMIDLENKLLKNINENKNRLIEKLYIFNK